MNNKLIDSYHCRGNSYLFEIELISLWISERIGQPPALILEFHMLVVMTGKQRTKIE